jgi:hypothetical protein
VVIDVASDLVPDLRHELPLVDQPGMGTVQQKPGIERARRSGSRVAIEAHRAPCRPQRRLGLATPARTFDENGARGPEAGSQFRISETWKVVPYRPRGSSG